LTRPARRPPGRLELDAQEGLADLVSAATYGTVLVLAALSAVGVSDVALGHGSELVAGVGLATWLAHVFAVLLGDHVRHHGALRAGEVGWAMAQGSPILASTVLPALVLMLGRLDVLADGAARIAAIVVAVVQLLAIGAFVGWVVPARPAAIWAFAGATVAAGTAVAAVTVALGH
jgi:hypothetical protein